MSETKPSENFKCQKYLQLVTPKLLVSFLERTLVDALLGIRNGLMQAICVISVGVSVKPRGCSKTIIFTGVISV